jgi:transposase
MITIDFSQEDIASLHHEHFHHPHPAIRKRMAVVYLKSQGLKHKEISQLCRLSKDSVTQYLKMYRDGGLEGLKKWDYNGKENELLAHEGTLKDYFRDHPPRSIAQARAAIEEITGITRSPTQVGVFLKRIGMNTRKVGFVPGKATDPEHQKKQEDFLNEQLKPRLEEAKRGERTLFLSMRRTSCTGLFSGLCGVFAACSSLLPQGASVSTYWGH